MTIQVEGLTQRQRIIADVLWAMDTPEQVSSFIASLPQPTQSEAQTVMSLMIWAMLDSVMDTDLAQRELARFGL